MLAGIVAIFLSIVCAVSIIGTSSFAATRIGDDGVTTAPMLDGNYAHINAGNVVEVIDGSEPFDANDDAGNDSSKTNGIVRSFDTASYDIEYSVDVKPDSPYAYFENGRVGIRAVLPYDSDQAEFAIDDMGWLDKTTGYKAKVTTETIDGKQCQVFVGYRQLIASDSNPTTIPGQGTLKLIINIKGLPNGTKIKPEVQLFAEHNESDEYRDVDVPELTVSAAPKYDIQLMQKQDRSSGRGDYPFGDSTSSYAIDKDAGDVNGAVSMWFVALRIVNDTASKGMKGVEFPSSDYTFSLNFQSKVKRYNETNWMATPDDYAPKVWCYYPSNSTGFATSMQRPVNHAGQYWFSNELMPAGTGGGEYACKQSGTLSLTRSDLYSVDCSVLGMQYDVDVRPIHYNGNASTVIADNVFYLSSFTMFVVQPFESLETGEHINDRLGTSDCDFQVTMSDVNLKAKTTNGVSIDEDEDGVSNQSVQNNDSVSVTLNVKKPGTFSVNGYYTRSWGMHSGVDMKNWTYNYANGYDTLPIGYNSSSTPFQIAAGFGYGQYEDSQIPVYTETLVKFDDTMMSIGDVPATPAVKSYYFNPVDTSKWSVSFQFGVKSDGLGWADDDEQRNADWSDLVWYDTLSEAQQHGTVVAYNECLHTPMDDTKWGGAGVISYMPMNVTDDMSKVNKVAAMTLRSRYWTRGNAI